jgi:hypothetical protein
MHMIRASDALPRPKDKKPGPYLRSRSKEELDGHMDGYGSNAVKLSGLRWGGRPIRKHKTPRTCTSKTTSSPPDAFCEVDRALPIIRKAPCSKPGCSS